MNLLNKKIKDKIKLLDDIDKQYVPKNQSKTKKNENLLQNEKTDEDINSLERLKKTEKENFDKVYSNFALNGNLLGKNLNSNQRNYSINNNNNCDKYLKKENSMNNENEKVGERLNNYGRYVKKKIEIQRQMINNKKNKTEKKEHQNSHQNFKKDISKSNSKPTIKNDKNRNIKKTDKKQCLNNLTNFTYHPKLNKKSLLLAKKMEPSSIRLNKRKRIHLEDELLPKMFYINLYKHKQKRSPCKTSNKKNDSRNKTIYEKMKNLYLRGVEQREKKEKKISENKKKKEEEYKKYTYKPKVNKAIPYYSTKNKIRKNLSLVLNRSKSKKNNSKKEFKKFNMYEKNNEWKKKIEKENVKKKKIYDEKLNKLCTFHPKIIESTLNNSNKKYLEKVFDQINDYLVKRRQNLKQKNLEDTYKKKKLYETIDRYTPRSTIPQEFEFQTEKRERSLEKNRNRSCRNFHVNQINLYKNLDKKSFGENENHSWFFKEDMSTNGYNYNSNISNVNESRGTREAFSHTKFDFVEAVNLLHDKLDKLNI